MVQESKSILFEGSKTIPRFIIETFNHQMIKFVCKFYRKTELQFRNK